MTKKDYIKIAEVLHDLGQEGARCFDDSIDRLEIARYFARMLSVDNPRFDTGKFMKAAVYDVSTTTKQKGGETR